VDPKAREEGPAATGGNGRQPQNHTTKEHPTKNHRTQHHTTKEHPTQNHTTQSHTQINTQHRITQHNNTRQRNTQHRITQHRITQPQWTLKLGKRESTDGRQQDATAVKTKSVEEPQILQRYARTPQSELRLGKHQNNPEISQAVSVSAT